jgi:hypothetical protein
MLRGILLVAAAIALIGAAAESRHRAAQVCISTADQNQDIYIA